jgi:hypothetical protein
VVARLKVDDRALRKQLPELERQLPFVYALTLTRVAQDAQKELREQLPNDFTIRSPWVSKGIRVQRATKRKLVAIVGSIDHRMAEQAKGATVRGKQAVPVRARKTKRKKTLPSQWPNKLIERRRTMIQDLGGGTKALYTLSGKGARTKLKLMYLLLRKVVIPKRWPIAKHVDKAVASNMDRRFREAVTKAVETSRRKG